MAPRNREIRNVIRREKVPQPHAFGLVRINGHIHSTAVIEAQRTV